MRPYNLELFDREFNFKGSALIPYDSFEYSEDAVDPEKNKVSVPSYLTAAKGDYVRIVGNGHEYSGTVSLFEAKEGNNEITYSSLITLFDLTLGISSKGVEQTTVEQYIMLILSNAFSSNSDTFQNITGISFVLTGSETHGTFDYATDTDEEYAVVNILDDIICPAFKQYNIIVLPTLNVQEHSIVVYIGVNESDPEIIEADLPGVTEQSFVIKKTNNEINKAELFNKDDGSTIYYYLHSDGTYDKDGTRDRVLPVISTVQEFSGNDIAKNAVAAKYQNYLDAFNAYNEADRDLTNDEYSNLQTAANAVLNVIDEPSNPSSAYKYINDTYITPAPSPMTDLWIEDLSPQGWGIAQGATHAETMANGSRVNVPNVSAYHTREYIYYTRTGRSETNYLYDELYNYDGRKAHIWRKHSFSWGWTAETGNSTHDNLVVWAFTPYTNSELSSGISAYKKTAAYQAEIEAGKAQAIANAEALMTSKIFSKNKYSNLIELTVKADNTMLNPLEMELGQECNIIHNGTSYNTLLTGREIRGDDVKLIFGTVRLELTKYLKGRY